MEQMDDKPFNRAKLFNVGVKEGVMKMEVEKAQKCNATSLNYCVILHDIDLIPVINQNQKKFCFNLGIFLYCTNPSKKTRHKLLRKMIFQLNESIPYQCQRQPNLLSSGISKFGYKMPYLTYFGGAVAISLKDFVKINGMSNE